MGQRVLLLVRLVGAWVLSIALGCGSRAKVVRRLSKVGQRGHPLRLISFFNVVRATCARMLRDLAVLLSIDERIKLIR